MGRLRTLDASPAGARGRSRPGRLALLDRYLLETERGLFSAEAPLVVDVGLGDDPAPTRELLRALPEGVRLLGVDIDEDRVANARRLGIDARVGGFSLPLLPLETPSLVRVMNVLRQYDPEVVEEAQRSVGAHLCEGGLVVDGQTDTEGHVLVAHLLRRRGGVLSREGLLFATDFHRGFAPKLFLDQLPQGLRLTGGAVAGFFARWTQAFEDLRRPGSPPAHAFVAAATELERTDDVSHGAEWLRWSLPGSAAS